jgi:hypothetical protein
MLIGQEPCVLVQAVSGGKSKTGSTSAETGRRNQTLMEAFRIPRTGEEEPVDYGTWVGQRLAA